MEKPMNTKYVFEFEDGTTCEMTLSFYALYLLRAKNKNLYLRYNKTMAEMADFATAMRSITQGTATFTLEPTRYEEVPAMITQKIIY